MCITNNIFVYKTFNRKYGDHFSKIFTMVTTIAKMVEEAEVFGSTLFVIDGSIWQVL